MSSPRLIIDPRAFTRDGAQVSEKRAVTGFERLSEAVLGDGGEVSFAVSGLLDADGQRWLDVEASGVLDLQCQRCLEPVSWHFDLSNRLLLIDEGRELPEDELEEDGWDAVPVGSRVDLAALVEDEVLLALPIAPRHEDCKLPSAGDGADETSPFAGLAQLRRPAGSK